MGLPLPKGDISHSIDKEQFRTNVRTEIVLLEKCFNDLQDHNEEFTAGVELEFFLTDSSYRPVDCIDKLLGNLNASCYKEEAARSCIEINTSPLVVKKNIFTSLHTEIKNMYHALNQAAKKSDCHLLEIGLLPSATSDNYKKQNLATTNRYQLIDKFFFKGHPKKITLQGIDQCIFVADSMAMMGSSCSFQINLRVTHNLTVFCYNLSLMLAAPLLAVGSNSACFSNKRLWSETRIPLLEQLFATSKSASRVFFGDGYLSSNIVHLFWKNYYQYAAILPHCYPNNEPHFKHLRLHNSSVYPWVRPVLDIEPNTQKPYIRLEFRFLPTGPTISDMIANMAFYIGLIVYFLQVAHMSEMLPFYSAKNNFYQAAKYGLSAELNWFTKKTKASVLIQELLPLSRKGLEKLGITLPEINYYLDVIHLRLKKNQSGGNWQLHVTEKYSPLDMLAIYVETQANNKVLGSW